MDRIYERQKKARKKLEELWKNPEQVNVIHYSCESFYDEPGKSSRITSIAVRNFDTSQTKSFSIHKYSQIDGLTIKEMEKNYDNLERKMLNDFFDLVKDRKDYKWIHWNMRDENYGFHALELRYKILGGTPFVIDDLKKYDLSGILIDIYGKKYIGHPRLEKLVYKNKISRINFKTGNEEAELFKSKNYVTLHQSTLAKTDILANLSKLAYEGDLKTNSSWMEIHGHSLRSFVDWMSKHPIIYLVTLTLSILANLWQLFN